MLVLYSFSQLKVAQMIKKYPKQCQELLLAKAQKKITAAQGMFVGAHLAFGSKAQEMEVEIMQY